MDRLPPELIALIISFLNEDGNDNDTTTTNLAAYAPISRQYQVAVEHLTFRRLRVQSGAEQLALFAERLLPRHRRAALVEIAFEVLLPAYSADRAAKFERRREREANNAAFTAAVAALFRLRAASVARIAAAGMPNLGRVEWELDDCAFAEDEVRHRYRKDFADALSAVANGRLTDFSLRLRLDDPQNDAFSVPSGTDPAAGVDALSVALHDWLSAAPKLVSFTLDMSLSPSIFGPDAALSPSPSSPSSPSSSSSQPPPTKYPHLRTARITTGRTTAAGTWLYSADADAQAVAAADAEEWEWHDPYDQSGYSSSACMTSWSSEELVDPDDSDWAETWHDWHDGLATGRRPRRHFRSRFPLFP
ncbi:putative f-box domain cyclin-like protein [Diplodia seriata]|uniref:Putative f-box domain cyclin-like protein n=1 Tax=Diplodia seriata TaxID=420778 RepID=A0A0G2DWW8_9PEZI|nr:putative f-box domain cyclin-like protein [Diplodia seriata]